MLDSYLKNVIASRNKPRLWLVKCSNQWLQHATREDFGEKLLPAIQRSLLRNPELILQSVSVLLEDLAIDLSSFAKDLIQTLAVHLMSKDEMSQGEAVYAIKSLCKQCSSNEALALVLKHLFSVLTGEAKSGTTAQKTAILTCIGNAALNSSQSLSEMIATVIQLFGDFFKAEANETVIF